MNLTPEQQAAAESKYKQTVVISSAGSGKAQPNSTKIPTPDGWKLLGDIKVGDYVFSRLGKPVKVLGVYPQGELEVYNVLFEDGRSTLCNDGHLWTCYDADLKPKTLTTREIMESKKVPIVDCLYQPTGYNYSVPVLANEVDYQEKETKISPFLMGKIIGCLGCVKKNISIPEDYLINSIDKRYELLNGLLRAPWNRIYHNDNYILVAKSKELVNQYKELCRSLGYSVMGYYNMKNGLIELHVGYIFDANRIVDIRDTGRTEEMTCIYVDDPEHLYLTNDFIVTHNTTVIAARAEYLLTHDVKPDQLYLVTYTNNAAEEMRSRLQSVPGSDKIFIGTIHSLAAYLLYINKLQTERILERARQEDNFDLLFTEVKRNLSRMYIPPIDHILVDEFQDTCANEYYFIKNILAPNNIFVVGDPKQSIYGFKGSDYHFFLRLCDDPETGVFHLTQNFRNKANIIYFANQAIKTMPELIDDEVIPMREGQAECKTIDFSLDRVCEIIKDDGIYSDWFVLARSNKLVNDIMSALEDYGIPCTTFRQAEKTNSEIQKLMKENIVKVLTIHSAKGLEANKVILFQNGFYARDQESRDEERRIRYVGITRARDVLIQVRPKTKKSRRYTGPYRSDDNYGFPSMTYWG